MDCEKIWSLIENSFYEKRNSHAFLIETNNYNRAVEDIKNIVKKTNCSNKTDNCECNICRTIDNDSNPDFLLIKPEGKEIKVDQISLIVNQFCTKPTLNNYSCYVIVEAEKLNNYSANKLLKFLEEPTGEIIGYYITNNVQEILPTIRSRCELYSIMYPANNPWDLLEISEEDYRNYYSQTFALLEELNGSPKYVLMAKTKEYGKLERSEIDLLFHILYSCYKIKYEYLVYQQGANLDEVKHINEAIYPNDLKIIVKRMKLLDNMIHELDINVNKELFFNKFFILWE